MQTSPDTRQATLIGSAIMIAAHRSPDVLAMLRSVVEQHFPGSARDYEQMDIHAYRELVSKAQDQLSEAGLVRRIVDEILPAVRGYLGEPRFLIQTNLYLRATRPHVAQEVEAVGWHRESFYGANMDRSVNIWTPIKGVDDGNTLRFVPGSQSIPDDKITVESVQDGVTQRFSAGHRIGFVYAPKKIVAGVDFSRALPMQVPPAHSAVFPAELIHGAATNASSEIRFSVDFRILPFSAWDASLNKSFHFASGKPYFEEY